MASQRVKNNMASSLSLTITFRNVVDSILILFMMTAYFVLFVVSGQSTRRACDVGLCCVDNALGEMQGDTSEVVCNADKSVSALIGVVHFILLAPLVQVLACSSAEHFLPHCIVSHQNFKSGWM